MCWEQITAPTSKSFPRREGRRGGFGGDGAQSYQYLITSEKSTHDLLWIANLQPPLTEIHQSSKILIIDLYGKKANNLGYLRFGIKETRCDINTAKLLKILSPAAKFVFLVREPFSVMQSIKRRD